jgi:hypothetical protein
LLLLLPSDRLKSLQPWRVQPLDTVIPGKDRSESVLPEGKVETAVARTQTAPMDFYSRQPQTEPALDAEMGIAETEKTTETTVTAAVNALDTHSGVDEVDLKAETRYSEILGTIALKRHETLSWIIQRVYGDFNSKYFKLLVDANPAIVDPDRVIVGQAISLPAVPVAVTATDRPHWWIRIDETDTLEAGLNLLRDNPDGSHPIRLIPYWSPASGTRFAVVLKELFEDERYALEQLAQLPPELSSKGMIFSFWNENYVYFADPFFGRTP